MRCKECGTEVGDGFKFCSNCGAMLVENGETPLEKANLGDTGSEETDLKKANPEEVTPEEINLTESAEKNSFIKDLFIRVKNIFMKNRKISIISICIAMVLVISVTGAAITFNTPIGKWERALNSGNYKLAADTYESNKLDSEFRKEYKAILEDHLASLKKDFQDGKLESSEMIDRLAPLRNITAVGSAIFSINNIEKSREQYKRAEDMYSNNELYEAMKGYKNVISDDTKNFEKAQAKIKEIVPKLKKISLDNAEKKAQAGDYKGATELLADINIILRDNDIKAEKDKYFKVYKQEMVAELKPKISVVYDDVDRGYTIVPKGLGTRYNNINYSRNIEPRVTVDKDISFFMITGFVQNDWIFTENVTISCDEVRHEYYVDYQDRQTQIFLGGIAEVMLLMHYTEEISGLADMTEAIAATDLGPLVNSICNSKNVRIRFSGDGYKDVAIPYNQCQEIGMMWKVFTLLEQDRTLIEQLK